MPASKSAKDRSEKKSAKDEGHEHVRQAERHGMTREATPTSIRPYLLGVYFFSPEEVGNVRNLVKSFLISNPLKLSLILFHQTNTVGCSVFNLHKNGRVRWDILKLSFPNR